MAPDILRGKRPAEKRVVGFVSSSSGSVEPAGSPGSEPELTELKLTHLPRVRDTITNPSHYARLSPQPVQVSVNWGLNYLKATALKYLARAGNKDGVNEIEDLHKAISYIEREIKRIKGEPVA